MNDNYAQTISYIERQFLQLVPAFRFQFFLPHKTEVEKKYSAVCDYDVQQQIFEKIFRPARDNGIAPAYIIAIVKAMVAVIEQQEVEVSGDILLLLIDLLRYPTPAIPPPGPVTYKFCTSEATTDSIMITETRNMISGYGTTGFRTWEAALALGEYVLKERLLPQQQRTLDVFGKRVLELGAGTGFASILCGKLGCKVAVATDGFENVVLGIRAILEFNNVFEVVETRIYKWGNSSGIDTGHALEKESREAEYVFNDPVDLIIGADIVSLFIIIWLVHISKLRIHDRHLTRTDASY
ncbi:uncharacterized protein V2V93DRAFT_383194 [Kockiozyma suomiensis]|uniref:uncharacterized protein n=1 Tax=Kockiozyma suomiensis TaxID=1337062 RepID=UPI0033442310